MGKTQVLVSVQNEVLNAQKYLIFNFCSKAMSFIQFKSFSFLFFFSFSNFSLDLQDVFSHLIKSVHTFTDAVTDYDVSIIVLITVTICNKPRYACNALYFWRFYASSSWRPSVPSSCPRSTATPTLPRRVFYAMTSPPLSVAPTTARPSTSAPRIAASASSSSTAKVRLPAGKDARLWANAYS